MTRRWSERSRRALTDLRDGGDVKEGGGGGGGVEELQLPYLAFCGVFFTGGHISLIMSSFIQEYEWLTTAKREI